MNKKLYWLTKISNNKLPQAAESDFFCCHYNINHFIYLWLFFGNYYGGPVSAAASNICRMLGQS